ncbi:MAG: hypothetical protein Q9212_001333 [Teloschistes hypoglaucus]
MLSIRPSIVKPSDSKYTPNLLPCKIHHDGPVNASSRYWDPQNNKDGNPEVYFRGRKLEGRGVKLPEGYRGVIVNDTVKPVGSMEHKPDLGRLSRRNQEDGDEDAEEEGEDVGAMEEVGEFEEVVVWGHERTVGSDDEVVKGVEEWISLAETIHGPGLQGQGDVQTKHS